MDLELLQRLSGGEETESEDEDVETELFSVLHHNDFSDGIPENVSAKYHVTVSGNEFNISLKGGTPPPPPPPDDRTRDEPEITCDTESESDSSCVIVEDPADETDPIVVDDSSSSPLQMSDSSPTHYFNVEDSHSQDDFLLNTFMGEDEDSTVSEALGRAAGAFKWQDVSSPRSWTPEMRKYYNAPDEKMRDFDHRKIRANLPLVTWPISYRDSLPPRKNRFRCRICGQFDHMAEKCPRKNPNCSMCGEPGHRGGRCPQSMCLNCGRPNSNFTAFCKKCRHTQSVKCHTCHQLGHEKKNCPNLWRQYCNTISGSLKNDPPPVLNPNRQCSNCGKKGHLFEDCRERYYSPYPPPASIVIIEGRKSGSGRKSSNNKKRFDREYSPSWPTYDEEQGPEESEENQTDQPPDNSSEMEKLIAQEPDFPKRKKQKGTSLGALPHSHKPNVGPSFVDLDSEPEESEENQQDQPSDIRSKMEKLIAQEPEFPSRKKRTENTSFRPSPTFDEPNVGPSFVGELSHAYYKQQFLSKKRRRSGPPDVNGQNQDDFIGPGQCYAPSKRQKRRWGAGRANNKEMIGLEPEFPPRNNRGNPQTISNQRFRTFYNSNQFIPNPKRRRNKNNFQR